MNDRIIVCGDFKANDVSQIVFSKELEMLFNEAECCICNFEGPLKAHFGRSVKSGPSLYNDNDAPRFLINKGFKAFLLANNHIMDYGKEGCETTIAAFQGVTYAGAGDAQEAYRVKTINVGGKTIGVLSLAQHEFGIIESCHDKNAYGAAWVNSLDVEDIIKKAKKVVDYLLVFPHAGVEHTDAPLPEWRRLYKKYIDWGADVVIGSHPHCPQGWEVYCGKHIFYSLGNFYWDTVKPFNYWKNSIAVELTIGEQLNITTYNIKFDEGHQVAIDASDEICQHIVDLNKLLTDEERYLHYIDEMCASHYEGIKYGILRGVCGTSIRLKFYWFLRLSALMLMGNKDEAYLLNAIQNESHRWVLQHYLNNKIKN